MVDILLLLLLILLLPLPVVFQQQPPPQKNKNKCETNLIASIVEQYQNTQILHKQKKKG